MRHVYRILSIYRKMTLQHKIAHINETEKAILDSFAKTVQGTIQPLEIILFGSKVRGDYTENSDIDILVIIKEYNKKSIDTIYTLVASILVEHSIYLSVKVWDNNNYLRIKELNTPFIQGILKEGIRLA